MEEGDSLPRLTYTVNGLVSGDKLNGTLTVEGNLAIGTYDIIQADDWNNRNYEIEFTKGTLTVIEKEIVLTKVDAPQFEELEYNGAEQNIEFINDELNDVAYTVTGTLTGKNVGAYTVTVTLKDGYTWNDGSVEPISLTWNIIYRDANITVYDCQKYYGEDDPKFMVMISGVIDGEKDLITYTLSREEGEDVGDYEIIVSGDEIQGNYSVNFINGVLTIDEPLLERIEDPMFETLQYNGEEQECVLLDDEFLNVGYELSGDLTGKNVGTYIVTATLKDGFAWDDGSTDAIIIYWDMDYLDVNIIPNSASKHAGEDDPDLHAQVEGVVDDFVIEYTLSREEGEEPGEYEIIVSGDEIQGNYRVEYMSATFTIEEPRE